MTSSGWADSQPFRRRCPGHFAVGATFGFCCRAIAKSSSNSRISKSSANARHWRKCRPARWDWHRPRTACPSTFCCVRNSTTGPATPTAMRPVGTGRTMTCASGDWPRSLPQLAAGTLDKNWAADLVHANDWQAALVPAYLAWNGDQDPEHPDHPQSGLSGSFSEGVAAPDRRARGLLSYRRPGVLRQTVLPQGRPRLRLASDHRQRDLCQGDHHV